MGSAHTAFSRSIMGRDPLLLSRTPRTTDQEGQYEQLLQDGYLLFARFCRESLLLSRTMLRYDRSSSESPQVAGGASTNLFSVSSRSVAMASALHRGRPQAICSLWKEASTRLCAFLCERLPRDYHRNRTRVPRTLSSTRR